MSIDFFDDLCGPLSQRDKIGRSLATSAKKIKALAIFRVYLVFSKILAILWFYAKEEILIALNGQILNK